MLSSDEEDFMLVWHNYLNDHFLSDIQPLIPEDLRKIERDIASRKLTETQAIVVINNTFKMTINEYDKITTLGTRLRSKYLNDSVTT